MNASPHQPGMCSVVMPVYNRATFLREALSAIRDQTYTQWELVIIDDGSTDDTKAVLDALLIELAITQEVRFIQQENGGPYAARNTGLANAKGEFIAFYDSDDLWLPHHLKEAVEALGRHPQLDWVYADSRKVDLATGKTVVPRGFHEHGQPHPLLNLKAQVDGKLRIYDDPNVVRCQLLNNLCVLLQTSVIRARVFDGQPFVAHYRNEGEDELYPIRAMKRGVRIGVFDDVHLVYRFHQSNSSTAAIGASIEKRLRVTAAAARGYEELGGQVTFTPRERQAWHQRLANEYFWKRGYAILWENGLAGQAMGQFIKGLRHRPLDTVMWRTFAACLGKTLLGRKPRPQAAPVG